MSKEKCIEEVQLNAYDGRFIKIPLKYFYSFNMLGITSAIYGINGKFIEALNTNMLTFVVYGEIENAGYSGLFDFIKSDFTNISNVKFIYNDGTHKQVFVPISFSKDKRTNLFQECKILEDGSLVVSICNNAKEEIERFAKAWCQRTSMDKKRDKVTFTQGGEA